LRHGVVDHDAKLGMETNLERIAAHKFRTPMGTSPRPGMPR
jgi:hypothetical protein